MALTDLELTVLKDAVASGFTKTYLPINTTFNKFSTDEKTSVKFPVVTAVGAVQENPTAYNTNGTATGAGQAVDLVELVQNVQLTPEDRKNGWTMRDIFESASKNLALQIHKKILSALPTTKETIVDADNFDARAFAKMAADVDSNNVSAMLDPDYFVGVVPVETTQLDVRDNGVFGYDSVTKISKKIVPTGVVASIYENKSIYVGSALPSIAGAGTVQEFEDITLEDMSGLTVRVVTWADPSTNSEWLSLRILVGAKVFDTSKVKVYGA